MDAKTQSLPVSDWKSRRLKVGHHIRNSRGEIGVVTWIHETDKGTGSYMYRLGKRTLGTRNQFTPADEGWINPTDDI